jgi:hypothetical protein
MNTEKWLSKTALSFASFKSLWDVVPYDDVPVLGGHGMIVPSSKTSAT